jgi:hypothetical protein
MGLVLQEPFLFSGTVAENIRYGREEATDEEVEEAARTVGAHDFISRLELGYETYLNERGMNLSVGQRQLISFARAIIARPQILILDEATANVDTQTEVIIQRALNTLLEGRTSFVIDREDERLDGHRILPSGDSRDGRPTVFTRRPPPRLDDYRRCAVMRRRQGVTEDLQNRNNTCVKRVHRRNAERRGEEPIGPLSVSLWRWGSPMPGWSPG